MIKPFFHVSSLFVFIGNCINVCTNVSVLLDNNTQESSFVTCDCQHFLENGEVTALSSLRISLTFDIAGTLNVV